ncbi:DNA replication and repair protein RecF [Collinsella tanakaei]|nr:DNA replication and repair protein RecF [Collinsella tanakaei]
MLLGIYARTLDVHDFRSYDSFELALAEDVTVLVGPNAAGKTNLVEAIQLLTAGQSFRRPSPADLVRDGASRAQASLRLEGDGRLVDLGITAERGRRNFTKNGKRVTTAGVRGILPSVLFCPDHLDMVKRSASVRRAALDDFGVQLNESYAQLVSSYERTLEQRNNLLKDRFASRDLLAAWDDALISAGSSVLVHRVALLERIRERLIEVYRAIAPRESIDVRYRASIGDIARDEAKDRDAVMVRFADALRETADEEARRGLTLVGPHRDEVVFMIDGREARSFASQGQQRSLVLAWKIAGVEVTNDILGRYPILLLDDVMSELDETRRESIVRFIAGEIQTVITTTNLGYFSSSVLDGAKVVHIGEA